MKALFFTTTSNDCFNHVLAWTDFAECVHKTFSHSAPINNDWQLLEYIRDHNPDVVFYIGACSGTGIPKPSVLKQARSMVPTINFVSDAGDRPWHIMLDIYRKKGCFDAQVSIDGVKSSPVDLVTLTPVSLKAFEGVMDKDIRCGFSGTLGHDLRSDIVKALIWFADLKVRNRQAADGYADHVQFIKRCQMVLNVSYTGSGNSHHIKGRVIEAGIAGCCLLEHIDSPIGDWFPSDCYISYTDPKHAAAIINGMDDATIAGTAKRLQDEVLSRFTPEMVYRSMLDSANFTKPRPGV